MVFGIHDAEVTVNGVRSNVRIGGFAIHLNVFEGAEAGSLHGGEVGRVAEGRQVYRRGDAYVPANACYLSALNHGIAEGIDVHFIVFALIQHLNHVVATRFQNGGEHIAVGIHDHGKKLFGLHHAEAGDAIDYSECFFTGIDVLRIVIHFHLNGHLDIFGDVFCYFVSNGVGS